MCVSPLRCASFDKVTISSCLCHLSVQAILFFSVQLLFFSLLKNLAEQWTVYVCVCELVWLFMLRAFFSTRNGIGYYYCDSYLWYEICLHLSKSYEACRTKVDWRYLYLTFANSVSMAKFWCLCFFFTLALYDCRFKPHIYTLENEYSKITNCICQKKMRSNFVCTLFVDSTYAQNSTHFMWVAWQRLVFNNSWHSHFEIVHSLLLLLLLLIYWNR